jgi:hypothetical protein
MASFENLYHAHLAARRGKQMTRDVIAFEMNLGPHLMRLKSRLDKQTYRPAPYTHFTIHEPKKREVYAPRYADRVVQHCLCDTIVCPALEPRLIFDNAACRVGKGTHFALGRLSQFMSAFHRKHGAKGFVLKYDIASYFAMIDHAVLGSKLSRVFESPPTQRLLETIINSYESTKGVGLPLGNQASQWFALYYLDSLDRLIKEKLRIRWYSRYMDDGVLLHPSKTYLQECLGQMQAHVASLGLRFNAKTQIFPLSAGVNYLGFHTYLTGTGKAIRRMDPGKKARLIRHLRNLREEYRQGDHTAGEVIEKVGSHCAHLEHGHTWGLRQRLLAVPFVYSDGRH